MEEGIEFRLSYQQAKVMSDKAYAKAGKGTIWTCDPTVELPVRVSPDPSHPGSKKPKTVIEQFVAVQQQQPNAPAMRVERNGTWLQWSYTQYLEEVKRFGKALMAVGFQPHQGVSIMGWNSPEWFIADMGTIFAGGIAAGIYTTNGPEAAFYIADHSDAKVVVVENVETLNKFLQVRDRLTNLECIVMWDGEVPDGVTGVYTWEAFMKLGDTVSDADIEKRMYEQKPGHCCTLIYTSGTTGNPKAVMISHDNLTWTASVCMDIMQFSTGERLVSYLPLSHIAAQLTDIHGPVAIGACVTFAKPDALKGSLVETLKDASPTMMLGVPRVWEKIEEKMRAVGAANTGFKKKIGDWAKSVGLRGNYALLEGKPLPWGWSIADKIVFSNVKKALGLQDSTYRVTSAAPISLKTLEYFMSLDMPLFELYGMSESSGPHTLNLPGATKMGTVGRTMPGAETWIAHPDAKGEGEICMRGRHIFMGYMKNEEATQETIDADGWLHSGDVGRLDQGGYLKITGRIKELIITAGGENIPPVLIEDVLKGELPSLSNAMLIGDKRKFLSCLVTLKTEPDADGNPTHTLAGPALDLGKSCGSSAKTVQEVLKCKKYLDAIQAGVDAANKKAISNATRINKWSLLENDFSVATGELTPTMKLKRKIVYNKYLPLIETFYEGVNSSIPARL